MDEKILILLNNWAQTSVFWKKTAVFFAEYSLYFLVFGAFVFYGFVFLKNWKEKTNNKKINLILILKSGNWNSIFLAIASLILSRGIITEVIRFVWHRSRPFLNHPIKLLIEHEATASFPSGHSAFVFALSAAIFSENKFFGIVFFVFGILMGLGRVACGVHYISDIVGGMILGIFSVVICRYFFKKFKIIF